MRCPSCNERLVRKGRNPDEGLVLVGRYVLVKAGMVTVSCKKCGRNVVVSKPTVVRTKPE